jgi:hypothetical protein
MLYAYAQFVLSVPTALVTGVCLVVYSQRVLHDRKEICVVNLGDVTFAALFITIIDVIGSLACSWQHLQTLFFTSQC